MRQSPQLSRRRARLAAPALLAALALAPSATAGDLLDLFGATRYPTLGSSSAPVVGDLDGDGRDDVVVAHLGPRSVSVFGGQADGSLAAAVVSAMPVGANVVRLVDMDADGQLDLLGLDLSEGQASVQFGLGDRTVSAGVVSELALPYGTHHVADVDGDGVPDLASVNATLSGSLPLALGATDGSFVAATPLVLPGMLRGVAFGDLDDDGDDDLIAAFADGTPLQILLADGAGGFVPGPSLPGLGSGPWPTVALHDVDGDGRPDLLAGDLTTTELVTRPGLGDGGFGAPLLSTLAAPVGLSACGDVTGDGLVDVLAPLSAFAPPGAPTPTLLVGLGGGAFTHDTDFAWNVSGFPALGDLDGDGDTDVVSAYQGSASLTVSRQLDAGVFLPAPSVALSVAKPRAVAVGDVDGDGLADLVSAGATVGALRLGQGGGGFGPSLPFSTGGLDGHDLAAVDLDGDGHDDLVRAHRGSDTVSVLLSQGDGSFAAPQSHATGSGPQGLAVGDLDGDGLPDVVVGARFQGRVDVLLALGGGDLAPAVSYAVGAHPVAVGLADLGGDGNLDVVTANWQSGDLGVRRGLGDGALGPLRSDAVGPQPLSLALGDVDGDGVTDALVGTDAPTSTAVWLAGDGLGGFGAAQPLPVAGAVHAVALLDADRDGLADVVTTSSETQDLWFLRGLGGGTFAAPTAYACGGDPRAVAVADVDQDDAVDLLVASSGWDGAVLLGNRCRGPWAWLDGALAGAAGTPHLLGAGPLVAGTPATLTLFDGPPNAPSFVVLGAGLLAAPFKGGLLVPTPDLLLGGLSSDADGGLDLPSVWPAGLPAGLGVFAQVWCVDAGGPAGFSASNGLSATTP